MADRTITQLPHLLIQNTADQEPYTYPLEVRGGGKVDTPGRNRAGHSRSLLTQLNTAETELERLRYEREAVGISADRGMYLTFESDPNFDLALKSLDRQSDGIELVAVQQKASRTFATVFVPDGKLQKLVHLVEQYESENDSRSGKPKNCTLVESVSRIQHAALEAFWTDEEALFPEDGQRIWWEVWLRVGHDADAILNDFVSFAGMLNIQLGDGELRFLDRTVVLALGTVEQMTRSVDLLDCIAELRRGKEVAGFFTEINPREQREWVDDFLQRVGPPVSDSPAVCVLDTGVSREHPLLSFALDEHHLLTCNPDWGVHDHHRHGTEMAGLALYGDLSESLQSNEIVTLEHRLESVKVFAPENKRLDANLDSLEKRKQLYGHLTLEAAN